jgi:hypothetical protein
VQFVFRRQRLVIEKQVASFVITVFWVLVAIFRTPKTSFVPLTKIATY